MKEPKKCCGECRWFGFHESMKTAAGKWKPDIHGSCHYPRERIAAGLPASVFERWVPYPGGVSRKDGENCPCYEMRQEE